MKFYKLIFIFIFFMTYAHANKNYFEEGLLLYKKKQFDKAKFKFEQDIVFNPKSEKSYLFLSKIYKEEKNTRLEEKNLNTVILLNPKNEEANYNLARLKLLESDFSKSKKLIDELLNFCVDFCKKSQKLKIEIENSQKK